jgi:nucleotide-binding universal stress UspA family protein
VTDAIDDLVTTEGEPAAAIEHMALQRNCDVIILGSHVRAGLERLLFGSVAEAVVRRSSLPVIVVPTKARSRKNRIEHGTANGTSKSLHGKRVS